MNVKYNYTCSLCSKQKTCFVFGEFAMLIAICRDCFEDLSENILCFEEDIDVCSFCDENSVVKKLDSFGDSTFFGDVFMCSACFNKLQGLINVSP